MKTVSFHDLKIGRVGHPTLLELNSTGTLTSDPAIALKPGLQILVAPNGHGKSTLFQTLAGILPSQGGKAQLDGAALDADRDILYVSEYLTFPKFIYPSEWIEFLSHRRWKGEAENELGPWIPRFQLEKPFGQFLGRMSQGERRKTTWLAAHASQKPVVLLDEPLDGLDLYGINAARAMLSEWKKSGRIVLLVAHQVSEVLDLCDEVFLIRDKKMLPWEDAVGGAKPAALGSDAFRAAVMRFYAAR